MKPTRVLLSALLCISAVSAKTSVIKHFDREWNITLDDLLIKDEVLGHNNIFPYAKCNLATGNERNCTVVLEAFHPDGVVYKNKCFTRFHTDNGSEGVNMLEMRAVKDGKIVFSYMDPVSIGKEAATAYMKFRVLDAITCKFHEDQVFINVTYVHDEYLKVHGQSFWLTSVLPYADGSVDAYLTYRNLCDGARCKVAFDANGRSLGKPVSYLSEDAYYNDVKVYSSAYHGGGQSAAKNLFIVVSAHKDSVTRHHAKTSERVELKLIYVKADGESKVLLNLKDDERLVADVDADREGSLSICWSERLASGSGVTAVNCRHYDFNETSLDENSSEFELPYAIRTLKIRRTVHSEAPISALLVLTDECRDEACESNGHYYLRLLSLKTVDPQYDAHHKSYNMEITGLNCPGKHKEMSISPAWNNDGLNACVSLTCQRSVYTSKNYHTVHRLVRQCFSMKYLDRPF